MLDHLGEIQADVWQVVPEVFEKMAYGHRHEGLLAVAETPYPALADLEIPDRSLIAVMESLEKPGNVGAVLRSADGAGLAATIVADPQTDLFNPNCIRASLGTIFTNPVCQSTAIETLAWLRRRGSRIFVARLDAERLYSDVDFRGDTALVLGSEAVGLSDSWQAADITPIRLPMRGTADSLNVSATAAVLFYEAQRQRGHAPHDR
jgi:TrmH family RNA methyltransferase